MALLRDCSCYELVIYFHDGSGQRWGQSIKIEIYVVGRGLVKMDFLEISTSSPAQIIDDRCLRHFD